MILPAFVALAALADAISTFIVLRRPGVREGNRLLPNHPIAAPLIVFALGALGAWAVYELFQRGYPSLGWVFVALNVAGHGFAGFWNLVRFGGKAT